MDGLGDVFPALLVGERYVGLDGGDAICGVDVGGRETGDQVRLHVFVGDDVGDSSVGVVGDGAGVGSTFAEADTALVGSAFAEIDGRDGVGGRALGQAE